MDASELRIGNLVDLYGSIATIERFDFNETPPKGLAVDKGTPIPLTEELLFKFGAKKANLRPPTPDFDNDDDEFNFWDISFDLEGVYREGFNPYFIGDAIVAEKMGKWYFVREITTGDESQILTAISASMEFVHTLQNYYPAFSGKELTFKN